MPHATLLILASIALAACLDSHEGRTPDAVSPDACESASVPSGGGCCAAGDATESALVATLPAGLPVTLVGLLDFGAPAICRDGMTCSCEGPATLGATTLVSDDATQPLACRSEGCGAAVTSACAPMHAGVEYVVRGVVVAESDRPRAVAMRNFCLATGGLRLVGRYALTARAGDVTTTVEADLTAADGTLNLHVDTCSDSGVALAPLDCVDLVVAPDDGWVDVSGPALTGRLHARGNALVGELVYLGGERIPVTLTRIAPTWPTPSSYR